MYKIARVGEAFLLNFTLSVSIGVQNSFLLQQALIKRRIFKIATICIGYNLLVLIASILGMQAVFDLFPSVLFFLLRGGAIYLFGYGVYSLYIAFFKAISFKDEVNKIKEFSKSTSIYSVIGVTFLNPSLYIDMLVVIGSRVHQYTGIEQKFFILGLILGEIVWIYGFSFTALFFSRFLQQPLIWRGVNLMSAIIMMSLAVHFYTMPLPTH